MSVFGKTFGHTFYRTHRSSSIVGRDSWIVPGSNIQENSPGTVPSAQDQSFSLLCPICACNLCFFLAVLTTRLFAAVRTHNLEGSSLARYTRILNCRPVYSPATRIISKLCYYMRNVYHYPLTRKSIDDEMSSDTCRIFNLRDTLAKKKKTTIKTRLSAPIC